MGETERAAKKLEKKLPPTNKLKPPKS